jgi:hypothetical protein
MPDSQDFLGVTALCWFLGITPLESGHDTRWPPGAVEIAFQAVNSLPDDTRGQFLGSIIFEYIKAQELEGEDGHLTGRPQFPEWPELPALKKFVLARYRQLSEETAMGA